MATITSAGSGLWSAGSSWVGGVAPADNDTVVVAAGHVIEFDADTSGYANGIAGITVNGTLKLSRAAAAYYLKIKAATVIGGPGTFDCGTAVDPIPFLSKHVVTGGNAWYIKGNDGVGLTMPVYGAEPAIKTVKLTQDEAIGATVLHVDTDVTTDIWRVGDAIRVDDINKAQESEAHVIANIASGEIIIAAGLTAAKSTGAIVSLITRNIQFIGVGASGYVAQNFASGKLTVGGGQWTTSNYRVFSSCTNMIISGGTFSGNNNGLSGCTGAAISGGTFSGNFVGLSICTGAAISGGTFSGNVYGLSNCTGAAISGGTFSGNVYGLSICTGAAISGGTFSGNGNGLNGCTGAAISGGTFSGNNNGLSGCTGASVSGGTFSGNYYGLISCTGAAISGGTFSGNNNGLSGCTGASVSGGTFSGNYYGLISCAATIKGAVFVSNTNDINSSVIDGYGITLTAPTPNLGYNGLAREIYSYISNYGGTGDYKAWAKGGVTSSQAITVPTGHTQAMQTVLENATVEGYWQKEISVGAGASVNITSYLRKAASMTYLPRVIVFNKADTDPFAGGAGLHTFTMTNSIDTWESEVWTYTNSTSADVTLVIRTLGMAASGSVYSAVDVEQINVDLTTALALINAVKTKTDNLPADPADESLLEAAIGAITVDNAAIAAAVMNSLIEGTITLTQAQRLMLSVLAGKASGGGTTTVTFRDTGDTTDRVVATVDGNGNRSAVTLDGA